MAESSFPVSPDQRKGKHIEEGCVDGQDILFVVSRIALRISERMRLSGQAGSVKRCQADGSFNFRKVARQRLRHGVRRARLRIHVFPGDAIKIPGILMKAVVAQLLLQVQRNHENTCDAECQSQYVDKSVCLTLY